MGGKTATTTQTQTIPKEVLDRYREVNQMAQNVAQTPFQAYSQDPNAFVAGMTGAQTQAIGSLEQNQNVWQPYYGAGASMALQSAGPSYANVGNYMSPYLNSVVGTTMQQLRQQQEQEQAGQTGNAIRSGAFGGDRAGIAAANLARQQEMATGSTISNLMNQGYQSALGASQADLARQLQAGQALAGMGTGAAQNATSMANALMAAGTQQQQTEQAGKTALYNQYLQERGYPFQVAQFLANIATGTGAQSGSTTTTQQPIPFWSDERLKENIERVGKLDDGQPIYRYNYKGHPGETQIGLLAQDVEHKRPDAVGLASGFKTVDYGKATDDAASMGGAVHPERAGLGFANGGYAGGGAPGIGPYSEMGLYGGQGGAQSYVPQAVLPVGQLQGPDSPPPAPDAISKQMIEGAKSLADNSESFGKIWEKISPYFGGHSAGGVAGHGYAMGGAPMPYEPQKNYFPTDVLNTQDQDKLKKPNMPEAQPSTMGQIVDIASKVIPFFLASGGAAGDGTFKGTSTGREYKVGQRYMSADGKSILEAQADGTFKHVDAPQVAPQNTGLAPQRHVEPVMPLERSARPRTALAAGTPTEGYNPRLALAAGTPTEGYNSPTGLNAQNVSVDNLFAPLNPANSNSDLQNQLMMKAAAQREALRLASQIQNRATGGRAGYAEGGWALPEELVPFWKRIKQQESGGRQTDEAGNLITGDSGKSIGLAQIQEPAARESAAYIGVPFDSERMRSDPAYNEMLGQGYLAKNYETYGKPEYAVAAYNAGPGRVAQAIDQSRAHGDDWRNYIPASTRDVYLKNVMGEGYEGPTAVATQRDTTAPTSASEASAGLLPADWQSGINKVKNWGKENESFIVPLLSGIGGMLASPSLTLGGSLGSGLMAGAQSYSDVLNAQQQRELQKAQAVPEYAGGLRWNDSLGMFEVIGPNGSYKTVLPSQLADYGFSNADAQTAKDNATTKPATGLAPPTGGGAVTTTDLPPVAPKEAVAAPTVKAPTIFQPTIEDGRVTVNTNFSPETMTGELIRIMPEDNKGSRDTYTVLLNDAPEVRKNTRSLIEFSNAIASIPETGFGAAGAGANERNSLIKLATTFGRITGQPVSEEELQSEESADIISKIKAQISAASASDQGFATEIAKKFESVLPDLSTNPEAAKSMIADMMIRSQTSLDQLKYMEDYKKQFNSWAGARTAFNNDTRDTYLKDKISLMAAMSPIIDPENDTQSSAIERLMNGKMSPEEFVKHFGDIIRYIQ